VYDPASQVKALGRMEAERAPTEVGGTEPT